jgi:uncharacterized membrane protein
MKFDLWFMPIFSLFLVAGALQWAIYWRRRSIFFGVRVPESYHRTAEGRATWRAFVWRLWAATLAAAALTVVALQNRQIGLAMFSPALVVLAASFAYYRAFRATLPHALPPPLVRTASLAVEPEAGRPVGWLGSLGPFVLLAGTALYLGSHWAQIPGRFPIHWGFDGQPNGWSNRTIWGVFWPLLLAAAIQALMLGMAWYTSRNSRHTNAMKASVNALLATAWFIAIIFTIVTLTPLLPGPPPVWAILTAVFGFVGLVIWLTTKAAEEPSDEPATSEEFWKWGQFYYNPNDSALFVEKRMGIGYTLNFAHRASWVFIAAVAGLPVLLVAFSVWK